MRCNRSNSAFEHWTSNHDKMTHRFSILLAALLLYPYLYAAPAPAVPVISCFGDSITAGRGVEPGHTYPDDLQAALRAHGYHYRVINQGISGDTSKDGVERLQNVLQVHPAVVIVEFGGNDGLRGIPIESTRHNLDVIVSTLLRSGSRVLLAGITLPPNYGADYIHQFEQSYRLIASKYHVPLLPELYAHIYTVPDAIQEDGVHPTAKGDVLLTNELLPLLLPMLKK